MANVNDFYRFRFWCRLGEHVACCVRAYRVTNIGGAGRTDSQLVSAYRVQIEAKLRSQMTIHAAITHYDCERFWPTAGAVTTTTPTGVMGTANSDALPPQTCGLIILRPIPLSFSNRPALVYVPFPAKSHNTPDGKPTNSYRTGLENLAAQLVLTMRSGTGADFVDLAPCVFRRQYTMMESVFPYKASRFWATQRRRALDTP